MLGTLAFTLALLQNSDTRLSAKVTLSENIASLKALCGDLQKQTHVPFVADKLVRDRKIALFVEKRSASEVMWAVEKALFLKFERDHDGYRLILPDRIRVEEQEIVTDEKTAFRDSIEDTLRRLAGLTTKPMRDLDMEYSDLIDRMQRLARQRDAKSQAELAAAIDRQRAMEGYRAAGIAAAVTSRISEVAEGLMSGETIVVTSDPKLSSFVIDPRLAPQLPGDKGAGQVPAIVYATLTYQPAAHELRFFVLDYKDPNSTGRQSNTDLLVPAKFDLSKERFVKRLSDWGSSTDNAVLSAGVPDPPKAPPSPYRGRAYSLADQLQYLSLTTGIPMVADAFRIAVSGEQYYSAKTVGQYVAKLMEPRQNSSAWAGYAHSENGWLMLRHADTWMRQISEVPEDWVQGLETKSRDDNIPSIDDYAKFAGELDADQAQPFRVGTPILMRCPRIPLYCMMPLRLLNQLSGEERDLAAKDGLTLDQLSPSAGLLFRSCIVDSMDSSGLSLADIRAVLIGDPALRLGCVPIDGREGFHMLDMEEIRFAGGPNPPMVDRADQMMFTYKLQNSLLGMNICTVLHKPPAKL